MRKKNDVTKSFIITTAFSLFQEKGYNNVTVKEICDACDITRGAFYYYYKTKDEILGDFFNETDSDNIKYISEALLEANYVDQFYKLFYSYLARSIELGPELLKQVVIRSTNDNRLSANPKNVPVYDMYITLIEKAQQAGEIKNMAPAKNLVDSAIYLSSGIGLEWCSQDTHIDFKEELSKLLNSLFMCS